MLADLRGAWKDCEIRGIIERGAGLAKLIWTSDGPKNPAKRNYVVESQVIAWIFHYLGVIDGTSATLETFKGLNPELLKDAKWQTAFANLPATRVSRAPTAARE